MDTVGDHYKGTKEIYMKVELAWYDIWVGFYWNRKKHTLYFCPLPMILITIPFRETSYE